MKIETQVFSEDIIHFCPQNRSLLDKGCEYETTDASHHSRLGQAIFAIDGVRAILIIPDCIIVAKKESADWESVKPQVLAEIVDFLSDDNSQITVGTDDEQAVRQRIEGVIALLIRPDIRKDGGNISLKDFSNGVARVELHGKCVGCPHAGNTLKNRVEKTLQKYIPQIKAVEKYEA